MTAKQLLSKITGIPEYRLNDDSGETIIKSGCLLAMEEYASIKAEEAFNAARETILPLVGEDINVYKDYQTFKNQKK